MAVSQPGPEDPTPPLPTTNTTANTINTTSDSNSRADPPPENGSVRVAEEPCPGLMLWRVDGCVLPFLGGFGRYQKQLMVLTWIPALFIGFTQFSDSFLLALPKSSCINDTINDTIITAMTTAITPSITSSMTNNSTAITSSMTNSTAINSSAPFPPLTLSSRNQSTPLSCPCHTHTWTHHLLSGLSHNLVTKWDLVCDSAWKVHIAKFSLLVGSIFGYLVLGVLADWFGRHAVLVVSVFFTLVFGTSVAFSINVTMFSTLRFFEGFWLAGITLCLYALRIELCLPGWRFSMTMVANFLMLAGQLLMPGVAALCSEWEILQAVIIGPLLLMFTYIWLFPESLRWLLATQQYTRAKCLIERIAKKNKTNVDTELITELNRVLEKPPKKTCIVRMVGTRNLWKNIVVLCVNSLTGYGIHHCFARSIMDNDGVTMFNNFYADYYTMAGIAVATCLALCPAVAILGRRGGLLMFMIITALASLLQLGLLNLIGKYSVQLRIESETLKSDFHVAFSIIGMFSSQAVSNLSIFFCAEITPTVIRGGGLGLVLASAGFGMLTAPIMELHNQKGYFLHHIIFACCTLICIICILLLPESRHQPLPESLSEGEGYTRHPLLPPHKKTAEQLRLLPRRHSSNYANVKHTKDHAKDQSNTRDMPLREVAVSTVESTTSATIATDNDPGDDLNAVSVLRHLDNSLPTASDSLPDLIINAPPADASESPPTPQISHSPIPVEYENLPTPESDVTKSTIEVSVDLHELVTPPITNVAPPTLSFCPPPSCSSPIDSDPLLSLPPQSVSAHSVLPSPPILDETLMGSLPLTVSDTVPPFKVESTMSSPIDSAVDCTISTANGGALS